MFHNTLLLAIKDSDIFLKYIPTQGVFEGGYLQSITNKLAIGMGGVVVPSNNVFIKSMGLRYKTKTCACVANISKTPQGDEYQLGYVRNVSSRTSLAADYVISHGMMGNLQSQVTEKYLYRLIRA